MISHPRPTRLLLAWAFAFLLLTGEGTPAEKEEKAVSLNRVSYAQLDKAVAKHRGKVVVIDLWGTWCIPCLQKFPKFVKMSKKHAGNDVVFMSLCLPIDEKKELQAIALGFLKKQKATFPNFLLADHEGWGDKFDTSGAPAVRVYGKDGKLFQQFSPGEPNADWTLEDVEKVVLKLLEKK